MHFAVTRNARKSPPDESGQKNRNGLRHSSVTWCFCCESRVWIDQSGIRICDRGDARKCDNGRWRVAPKLISGLPRRTDSHRETRNYHGMRSKTPLSGGSSASTFELAPPVPPPADGDIAAVAHMASAGACAPEGTSPATPIVSPEACVKEKVQRGMRLAVTESYTGAATLQLPPARFSRTLRHCGSCRWRNTRLHVLASTCLRRAHEVLAAFVVSALFNFVYRTIVARFSAPGIRTLRASAGAQPRHQTAVFGWIRLAIAIRNAPTGRPQVRGGHGLRHLSLSA